MFGKYIWLAAAAGLLSIAAVLSACAPKPALGTPVTTTPGPGGGLVVNSDSIITGTIVAIHSESTGYPWRIDVRVLTSQDVGTLPNPTKDKIGQTVSFYTDENVNTFHAGQSIKAHVKYAGDVPKPGIILYIFDIK
jgi:hypothetical protein